jgi:hypothetical protein
MTTKKDDIITYVELLVELYITVAEGKRDEPEAEKIRNQISEVKSRITPEDVLRLNWLALNMKKLQNIYLLNS